MKNNEFKIFIMMLCCALSSCTYSINMVHTDGQATDLIDETQSAQPDIKPNLTIPAI